MVPRKPSDFRSGGKTVKSLRNHSKTPYDRTKSTNGSSVNPNWLSSLVFPATRKIANGAGKIISTVFGSDTSSSTEYEDSVSEDDVELGCDDNSNSSHGSGWLNKKYVAPSEMIKCLSNKDQVVVSKTETKRVIENLLTQETFTREEGDRLIEIIKVRVTDTPMKKGVIDTHSKTVMEARKWIEERKSGLTPKSELNQGNLAMTPHVTENNMDSPVDMAKSYMRARPLWASPTANIEYHSPQPTMINFLKEEASNSVGCSTLSTFKLKKETLASGSWNIREEIRRVRSKATEDLLKSPSSKSDILVFDLEQISDKNMLLTNKLESNTADTLEANAGPILGNLNSLQPEKSTEAKLDLISEIDELHGNTGPVSRSNDKELIPSKVVTEGTETTR